LGCDLDTDAFEGDERRIGGVDQGSQVGVDLGDFLAQLLAAARQPSQAGFRGGRDGVRRRR